MRPILMWIVISRSLTYADSYRPIVGLVGCGFMPRFHSGSICALTRWYVYCHHIKTKQQLIVTLDAISYDNLLKAFFFLRIDEFICHCIYKQIKKKRKKKQKE